MWLHSLNNKDSTVGFPVAVVRARLKLAYTVLVDYSSEYYFCGKCGCTSRQTNNAGFHTGTLGSPTPHN